jgi:transposase
VLGGTSHWSVSCAPFFVYISWSSSVSIESTLLGKIEGGLDHWLTFIGEPAVSPTNNAAENALREPVVLRKIIGTLRTGSGMFVHETVLSLLETWRQQGNNPYDELKRVVRDNEMGSRCEVVPAVDSMG